jgi:uncharacterized YccA/Bax inhibitor family protein
MSNPLLNEKSMGSAVARDEGGVGWAAPSSQSATQAGDTGTWNPPVNDGPVSRWDSGVMTVSGTASATLMLALLLIASATVTWFAIDEPVEGQLQFPTGWVIGGLIIGLIAVIAASFKPHLSRILAPIYAIAEGVVVGAISRAYSVEYDGIVIQAVGATLGVFVVMLLLYRSRVIRVTERYRRIVMGALIGLMAFYLVSFIFGLFGAMPSFISDASPLGIGFSVVVAGIAAFTLALDFDMIEMGAKNKMPGYMEWYCALGLLVTLVWLYLEILRLLAKLREN